MLNLFLTLSLFSGPIGLDPCAVTCASILHKTSTTSGAMSLAAMHTCSHCVRWHHVLSASLLATPRPSRSTCCSSMPKLPSMHNLQGKGLQPTIAEMRGITVEDVHFQALLSLP